MSVESGGAAGEGGVRAVSAGAAAGRVRAPGHATGPNGGTAVLGALSGEGVAARVGRRVGLYARFVKLSHTGFALPFALVGAILASYRYPVGATDLLWIVVAFTAARFAAMGFNRIVDRELDARNPRTSDRELPAGRLSVGEAKLAVAAASTVFVLAAGMLNPLCLALSPVALAAVLLYSYAKRFTAWTHVLLGIADGIAPGAGYLAIAGEWSEPWFLLPLLLLAVAFWVGGFDVLYSLQDVEMDRRSGLHSVPARFGRRAARWVAGTFHVGTVVCLAAVPAAMPELGAGYAAGLAVAATLLGLEHGLFDPDSPAAVQRAFFTLNVWLSSAFTLLVLADRLL
ncbi:MAG: UbiA-like polyprenyltransferase [Gemmatimonadota bacterium]